MRLLHHLFRNHILAHVDTTPASFETSPPVPTSDSESELRASRSASRSPAPELRAQCRLRPRKMVDSRKMQLLRRGNLCAQTLHFSPV
eukprot:2876758-Alexandrium_andersonii.AAC.1